MEEGIKVRPSGTAAAGVPGVLTGLRRSVDQMGVVRTAETLSQINQPDGFDCPGCAWPEAPGERHIAEFCENGAKAVAEEATTRTRRRRSSSPQHSRRRPGRRSPSYWLGQQGRLTHPMVLRAGRRRTTEPIELGRRVRADRRAAQRAGEPRRGRLLHLGPHQQRGRVPLPARSCAASAPTTCPTARTCATSRRGIALAETIGIGKGTVTLEDFDARRSDHRRRAEPRHQPPADADRAGEGQARTAPGSSRSTRCPRPGSIRFKNPQTVRGVVGGGTPHRRRVPADPARRRHGAVPGAGPTAAGGRGRAPGTVSTATSSTRTPTASTSYARTSAAVDWDAVLEATGLVARADRAAAATMLRAVATRPIVLLGDGPDPAPQRGGDDPRDRQPAAAARQHRQARRRASARCAATPTCRATARWASGRSRRTRSWTRLDNEFGFTAPREHGYDTVEAIRAMRDGRAQVFIGLGGNFVLGHTGHRGHRGGTARLRTDRADLDQAQPLATWCTAARALILPTLGRTELDVQAGGPQFVSVEDSMSMVHLSRGSLQPAERPTCAARWRSSAGLARSGARAATSGAVGAHSPHDYDLIRDEIAASGARLRATTTAGSGNPTASSCRTRRGTPANSPPQQGKPTSPSTRWSGCRCRRAG